MKLLKRLTLYILVMMMMPVTFGQWNPVTTSGTTFILYGMHFPPGQNNIGYACGMQYTYNADGVIVKTTDGGDNWTQIWPTSGSIDGLQGIWFINDTVGFAVGWNDHFIKTTDGGATWTDVSFSSGMWYWVDVEFWDANNGIAAGYPNSPTTTQAIWVTSDGGNTWSPASSGTNTAAIMGVSYATQNTIYAVGTDANVLISTDGGDNWSVHHTLPALLFGVDFADANFGVVGAEEKMFATTDGGATWTTHTTGYENFYAAKAYTNGTGYIGGTDGRIWKTTDFGGSWTLDYAYGTSSLYRIRETANGTLFACGSQGYIFKNAPPLVAGFTADDTEICVGSSVTFTDNSTGSPISWNWTFEGGTPATSTQQNPVVTYNTTGTFDVTLQINDGSNNNTIVETDYITVSDIPGQTNPPTGETEVCNGESYTYTTNTVAFATSYDWVVDPGTAGTFSGSDTNATFTASSTYTGAYTVKVRATNDCGDGAWSSTLACNMNFMPTVFQLEGGGTYCEGGSGVEITLSGSETGVDYELYHDDVATGNILAGTGNPLSFGMIMDEGLYTAVGYTASCTEDMIGQLYVGIDELPAQAGTPAGPETACNTDTSSYSTSGASGATSYGWNLDPANAGTLTTNGGTYADVVWAPDFTGTATITVWGVNDCGDGATSDAFTTEVGASPAPAISGINWVCVDEEAMYATEDHAGNIYTWEVTGGEIIAGAGTYEITVKWGATAGTGTVNLTEETATGCMGYAEELTVTIDECTSIIENNQTDVSIYPNPATSKITIESNHMIEQVVILDITGKQVRIIISGSEKKLDININDLKAGMYFMQLKDSNGISTHKLYKE